MRLGNNRIFNIKGIKLFKNLYSLTKPGIIFGNLITALGGFFLASRGDIHYFLLLATILGISLVIASGCVFNNIIDRDIDKLMERTKNRVLATNKISVRLAFVYALVLGILGIGLLYFATNMLTVIIACFGLFIYVGAYSLWLKRHSIYGTLIGSFSGAVPPVVGYCAVTNKFDGGALLLFLILSIWQIPHSYAIAIFRFDDYARAKIPVLPVRKGLLYTKIQMLIFVLAFVVVSLMLTLLDYTGYIYFAIALILGLLWIRISILGFTTRDDKKWARKTFAFSVICLTILSISMSIDYIR